MEGELIPFEVQNDIEALESVMLADEVAEASALIVVNTPQEQAFAATELQNVARRYDALEAAYKRLKEPNDVAIKRLQEFFAEPMKRLKEAEATIKRSLVGFQQRETARVSADRGTRMASIEEQVMTLRAQADEYEVASLIKTTMEEAEECAGKAAECRAKADQLAQTHVPAELVPKASGVSTRANWKGEVTDFNALFEYAAVNPHFRSLFEVDAKAVKNHASMTKGATVIPGLRIFDEGTAAVKRGKPRDRRSPESPSP
jgi:hypothetical protein